MSSVGTPKEGKGDKSRISNPRRILVLTPSTQSHATIPPFLHRLTGVPVAEGTGAGTISSTGKQGNTESVKETSNRGDNGEDENDHSKCKSTTTAAPSSLPTSPSRSFAGYTTHAPLRLDTKYYTADIPIWVDEIPLLSSQEDSGEEEKCHADPSTWKAEFLGAEAREVRDAVGAVVVCICPPERVGRAVPIWDVGGELGRRDAEALGKRLKEVVGAVAEVKGRIDEERGGMGDVVGLVVVVEDWKRKSRSIASGQENGGGGGGGEGIIEVEEFGASWWDEELNEMGIFDFEVVNWHPSEQEGDKEAQTRRNEFGELQGMARIREVFEANDWTSSSNDEFGQGLLEGLDDGFDLEANELEREMLGLRMAIENEDDGEDDLNVEELETLMQRVQAIRDMGSDMPEAERKQFAAKAIRDIMNDL